MCFLKNGYLFVIIYYEQSQYFFKNWTSPSWRGLNLRSSRTNHLGVYELNNVIIKIL